MKKLLTNRAGFTFAELMVASAIGSIIAAGIITTYIFSIRSLTAVAHYTEIHGEGRHTIDIFARDMRAVNRVISMNASNLVVSIPTGFDRNGSPTNLTTVTYSFQNGTFYRSHSGTGRTAPIATNVHHVAFQLYDRLGSNTTSLSNAKGVQLDLKLRKYVVSQIQSEDYLSARMEMRNKP